MILPPADLIAASRPALLITVVTSVFSASVFCASMSSAAMAMMSSPSINCAVFVAEQDAVGVAVVRNADVRLVLDHLGGRDSPGASSRNPG